MKHVVAVKDTWGLKKGTGASGLKFSLFLLAAGLCFLLFFYLFCLSPFFPSPHSTSFISILGYPWSFP